MAKRTRPNMVMKLAFVCVLGFLVISVIQLQVELKELRTLKVEQQAQVQMLEDDIAELTIRLNTPISDEYIERVARAHGYRMPNEIIFYNDIAD
ncbi:MAG: septum formation initiator family protein [Clostridia bacterium]|nr:septum formation initiator family protein [Clostridia bacterium]